MAKISLRETGFKLVPEGKHVFKITKVDYKQDYEKIEVTCETKEGQKQIERFVLSTDGGARAFSYFAHKALNDENAKDIDSDDLVGCYFIGTVEHITQPNKNDPSKTVTFSNIVDKESVDEDFEGWETVAKTETKTIVNTPAQETAGELDLDDLLGD